MTRILIVDDHEIVREGIRTLLAQVRPGWEICGEATNGVEAIELVKMLRPDVVILDITMPVMSGLEAASRIRRLGLGCQVLMFTMHDSERLIAEVRETGAQGCVLKSQAARDLVVAIDKLLAGGTFFGGQFDSALLKQGRPRPHLPRSRSFRGENQFSSISLREQLGCPFSWLRCWRDAASARMVPSPTPLKTHLSFEYGPDLSALQGVPDGFPC